MGYVTGISSRPLFKNPPQKSQFDTDIPAVAVSILHSTWPLLPSLYHPSYGDYHPLNGVALESPPDPLISTMP